MQMASISPEEIAELFGEASTDGELESELADNAFGIIQPSEQFSQDHESAQKNLQLGQISAAEQQELWLVDTQPGLQDAHQMVDFLAKELDDVVRDRSVQYSNFTRQLDYMTRERDVEQRTADEALRNLRHKEYEMACQMGQVQAQLQGQQSQAAALQQALRAAQAQHAQSTARTEYLERINTYQSTQLMKMQREVYHLRSLLASHGIDLALASQVPPVSPWSAGTTPEHLWDTSSLTSYSTSSVLLSKSSVCSPSETLGLLAAGPSAITLSPWSMATTPEHLWDTSSRTPLATRSSPLSAPPASHAACSSPSEAKGLSSAASSPPICYTAAVMTSSPERPGGASAGPLADSSTPTGQADASAGGHSSSVQRRLDARPDGAMFSGSPVRGLCRTGPQLLVRMTKKQRARQDAVALKLSSSTSSSAGTAPGTSSTLSPPCGSPVVLPSVRRRLDATLGTVARPSPAAGRTHARGEGTSVRGGRTPITPLSTGKRLLVGSSKGSTANSCNSNEEKSSHISNKENSWANSRRDNSIGTGKAVTPATISHLHSQQQPLSSRAPPHLLTPSSPATHRSPIAPMTAADVTPFLAMTPHPLQLRTVAVPFWGLPAPPLAAANDDVTSTPPTIVAAKTATPPATVAAAIATPAKFSLTNSTVTAEAPTNAATAATATTAAGGTITAALPDKAPVANALHISDAGQVAAPAASVEPCQTPLPSAHAERQQRPCLPRDLIGTAIRLSPAPGSSSATSSQHIAAGEHIADSLPRRTMVVCEANTPMTAGGVDATPAMTPHPLQLRTLALPFWGLPAPSPLAAAIDDAMISGMTTTTAAATATELPPTDSTATAFATAAAAATAIDTQASISTAAPQEPTPAAALFHTAGAEQAAAGAVSVQSSEAHWSDSHAERQQRPPFPCDPTSSANSSANSSTISSQQTVADQHAVHSLPKEAIADAPGAAVGMEVRPRGNRRRTALAAAPTASRVMTRSQAAALKHVQRMQVQHQKRH